MTPLQPTLEDTLCSKVRLKILKLLIESQMLNTSQIAAKVGVNYAVARAHLDILERADILRCVNFGKRICYCRFSESAKVKARRSLEVNRMAPVFEGFGKLHL
jgi:predicted transcriptional regulator